MGNCSISRDLKIAALNLYEQGHLPLKTILSCVGFSRRTFFRMLNLWRTIGDVERKSNRPGRPRLLHHDDVDYLILLGMRMSLKSMMPSSILYLVFPMVRSWTSHPVVSS
jgi:hypothetical protein